MTGQNSLDFISLKDMDDERSGGRVVSWITSAWKDNTGTVWGGLSLMKLVSKYRFYLHTQYMCRIWTNPPASK